MISRGVNVQHDFCFEAKVDEYNFFLEFESTKSTNNHTLEKNHLRGLFFLGWFETKPFASIFKLNLCIRR